VMTACASRSLTRRSTQLPNSIAVFGQPAFFSTCKRIPSEPDQTGSQASTMPPSAHRKEYSLTKTYKVPGVSEGPRPTVHKKNSLPLLYIRACEKDKINRRNRDTYFHSSPTWPTSDHARFQSITWQANASLVNNFPKLRAVQRTNLADNHLLMCVCVCTFQGEGGERTHGRTSHRRSRRTH
jgi:hypothetical protein